MEGAPSTRKVCEDFDGLAVLSEEGGWDHNSYYHDLLLGSLPMRIAERSDRVVAIDLSPLMAETASARSGGHPNVEHVLADASS